MNARPMDIDDPPCEALMPSGNACVDGMAPTKEDIAIRDVLRELLRWTQDADQGALVRSWLRCTLYQGRGFSGPDADRFGPGRPSFELLSTGYRADPCVLCGFPEAEYIGGDPICYALCDACLALAKADLAGEAS